MYVLPRVHLFSARQAPCRAGQSCSSVKFKLVLSVQPLAAVFMMNNLHYMVKTVESSEALTVLGEEWIEQHKDQARA